MISDGSSESDHWVNQAVTSLEDLPELICTQIIVFIAMWHQLMGIFHCQYWLPSAIWQTDTLDTKGGKTGYTPEQSLWEVTRWKQKRNQCNVWTSRKERTTYGKNLFRTQIHGNSSIQFLQQWLSGVSAALTLQLPNGNKWSSRSSEFAASQMKQMVLKSVNDFTLSLFIVRAFSLP